jgi:small acid-soluble spore protein F (minor alpha/beta-type SASP)
LKEDEKTQSEDKPKSSKMKKNKPLTADDIMKYEIAEELGLMEKVNESGWKSLTARESGKIGGLMTKKKRDSKL